MENEELFKVMWVSSLTGTIRTFVFDRYEDDKQNQRYIFIHEDSDKVLTLHYHSVAHLITSPYEP